MGNGLLIGFILLCFCVLFFVIESHCLNKFLWAFFLMRIFFESNKFSAIYCCCHIPKRWFCRYFFITPLFKNLTAASSSPEGSVEKQGSSGYIVVETNYRVYAYTDSNLQLAILSTFTEMLHRSVVAKLISWYYFLGFWRLDTLGFMRPLLTISRFLALIFLVKRFSELCATFLEMDFFFNSVFLCNFFAKNSGYIFCSSDCTCFYRFDDMSVGILSREAVRRALQVLFVLVFLSKLPIFLFYCLFMAFRML